MAQASAWATTIWQHSTAKSVKQHLAGNSYRERVSANEFNMLAGAMPLLDLPDRELTAAGGLALKCILDHILNNWSQAVSMITTSSWTGWHMWHRIQMAKSLT